MTPRAKIRRTRNHLRREYETVLILRLLVLIEMQRQLLGGRRARVHG